MSDFNQEAVAAELLNMGRCAREASRRLAVATTAEKNQWLLAMAQGVLEDSSAILAANAQDMADAVAAGLSTAMQDRLRLDEKRLKAMADGLRHVATLPDPVGRILEEFVPENGLQIQKVSVPIGVLAIIYESRPNVTVDAAGLCLKAGNCVILRGGKESFRSNRLLVEALLRAGKAAGMPEGAITFFPWREHAAATQLLKLDKFVDLVIPRGGEGLIRRVMEQATMPVLKHYKGVCHVYVDEDYSPIEACRIVENAKCQRPGVCNALETLLIHRQQLPQVAPLLDERLPQVEFHGDASFVQAVPRAIPATEEDWYAEYLDLRLAVRVVDSLEQAIEHINTYGSGHSDAILTRNADRGERFLNEVDSSTVYVNASTRFTDGGEFGFGAEIGISTDKLHARGPMGLRELTSYKYKVRGNGQIRG